MSDNSAGRHRVHLALTASVIVAILLCILSILVSRWYFRSRFEQYSGISLRFEDAVIEIDDKKTSHFIDGSYNATIALGTESFDKLRKVPPSWAASSWQRGRQINLAQQLNIPTSGDLIGVIGFNGRTYRIVSLDCKSRRLYFEMKEY
jgi:hypothetical protein